MIAQTWLEQPVRQGLEAATKESSNHSRHEAEMRSLLRHITLISTTKLARTTLLQSTKSMSDSRGEAAKSSWETRSLVDHHSKMELKLLADKLLTVRHHQPYLKSLHKFGESF